MKLFWKILLILSLLAIYKLAYGEPVDGQDYLALQQKNFNVVAASSVLPHGQAVGMLDTTFGTDLNNPKYILSHNYPAFFRVHILNCTCVRNNNCGPYEIVHGYTKQSLDAAIRKKDEKILRPFKRRVVEFRGLSLNYPLTKFVISPALEHDLSKEAWRILADNVLLVWPGVQLSNSPDGGVAIEGYKNAWIERHGTEPQSDVQVASPDGSEITDANIPRYKKRTQTTFIRFGWTRSYNCRTNSPTFVDPRARTACPSRPIFEEVAHIYDSRGDAPNFAGSTICRVEPFNSPAIWKPLAEDTGNGDSRANKPVVITSAFQKRTVNVITKDGNKVGQLGFYGTYLNLGLRFYSGYIHGDGLSGYQYEKRSRAVSGSPYVWLQQGRICRGPLITGMRQGTYR